VANDGLEHCKLAGVAGVARAEGEGPCRIKRLLAAQSYQPATRPPAGGRWGQPCRKSRRNINEADNEWLQLGPPVPRKETHLLNQGPDHHQQEPRPERIIGN